MIQMRFQPATMALAVATITMGVGVVESAERTRSTRQTGGSASVKADGSLRHDATPSQRSGSSVQVPVGAIVDDGENQDWPGLINFYDTVDVSTIVGPVEVVGEFSVTDGKSNDLYRIMPEFPEEGLLVAVTAVNLVGGFVLEPGETIHLGDVIDDGLIANMGETAFTLRLANGSEAVLPPTIAFGVVPTKGATCCVMCTSCELGAPAPFDLYCLSCEACNDAGLPRLRGHLTLGNPCLED